MNIEEYKIEEWARKCGYTGPIPKKISSFCNESTFHIWTDIIAKVKPRNEVKDIKCKLIIHRLKCGVRLQEAMQKDSCDYNKLTTFAKFKEEIFSHIAEKQLQLQKSQHLLNKNRFEFERIKDVNKDMEMKIIILEEKNEALSMNISKIQPKVTFMENSVFKNNELNLYFENIILHELSNYVDTLKFGIGIESPPEKNKLADLFHNHRESLFNAIKVSEDNLYKDLENHVEYCQNINRSNTNQVYVERYDDELLVLNAVYIENEIQAKMFDKSIKELQQSLKCVKDSYKNKLLPQMRSNRDINETMKILHQKAKLIGLEALNTYLQKNICDLKQHLTLHSNKLKHENLKLNLQEINESIKSSVKNISTNLDQIYKNQSIIELKKSQALSEIATLSEISLDYLSITEEKLVSKELDVFQGYPLNYNNLCNVKGNVQYFRTNHIFDQPSSNLICKMNVNPLQTSWDVITAICNDLKWLTQLIEASKPSITLIQSDVKIQILTQNLERNSELVKKLISHLKSANKGMHLAELQFQKHNCLEMLKIWTEMKFGEFYTQDSFFHNSNFKHYYKDFMLHYNML